MSFEPRDTLQRAFVRSLEVIGEASKKVPDVFRAGHPDITWRAMAGMRDRLIHHYFGVDYEIVWDVVQNRIPELRRQVSALLEELQGHGLVSSGGRAALSGRRTFEGAGAGPAPRAVFPGASVANAGGTRLFRDIP